MKVIRRIGLAALIVFLVGVCSAVYLGSRSLPDYEVSFDSEFVSGNIEIVRTNAAIPHIFAEDDADVYFGLGYAHAQDRLWQMEMFRRTSQGRLSEMLGEPTLRVDELLRRFGLYAAAEQSLDDQDPYTTAALEAYAAGVNARLEQVDGWGLGAPEFLLFPVEIEPWRPQDSLAILKLLALQLASHVDREVLRARVSALVPPERLADILPDDPNPGISPSDVLSDPLWKAELDPLLSDSPLFALEPYLHGYFSSNAWAAGPDRTENGFPLLANDTHLNFSAPSVWYLARLDLDSGAVIGGTIPGVPTILSGRNDSFAWGLTAANMDDQDVFIEQQNPDNPGEVLTPDGFRPLRVEETTIEVKGGDPVTLDLMWSENGPIIPRGYYNLAEITPPGHLAAIGRTLFDPNDTSMSAAHRLLRAHSVAEAIVAVESFVAPAQNVTMVDQEHFALQMIGRMPMRQAGHTTLGRTPSQGWIAENRWSGYLPFEHNPRFVDLEQGYVGNTNSRLVDRDFPLHVSFDWGDTQRILRLEELMRSSESHSQQSFMAGQVDTVSASAVHLVPLLIEALGNQDGRRAEALGLLARWDGKMDADRPEPLIYAIWIRTLHRHLVRDEIGPLADEFKHANPVFLDRVLQDTDGAAVWCDNTDTTAVETCAQTVGEALDATLQRISEAHGSDLSGLRWGDVHIATHDHTVLGDLPVLGRLVNIRHPSGGGDDTLLRGLTHGDGAEPMWNLHGALFRSVVDMADPESAVFVISTGQSGHPFSRHYRDMNRLWRDGEYVSMALDAEAVRAEAMATTRISPN